jgi:hypothetical protein
MARQIVRLMALLLSFAVSGIRDSITPVHLANSSR